MKEIVIDGVTYTLTPKEVLVFGKYKIGSCVVSLTDGTGRRMGDVYKVLSDSDEKRLSFTEFTDNFNSDLWRQATEEETAEYEKRGGIYNISELLTDADDKPFEIGAWYKLLDLEGSYRKCKFIPKSNFLEYDEYIHLYSYYKTEEVERCNDLKRLRQVDFSEVKKFLIPKFPKTWEELELISGWYILNNAIISGFSTYNANSSAKNIFATKEQAEASIALAQLSQLLKVYRGDWNPNWKDYNYKYAIKFSQDVLEISSLVCSNDFITLPTEELAQEFLNNFRDLIEKAKPLL